MNYSNAGGLAPNYALNYHLSFLGIWDWHNGEAGALAEFAYVRLGGQKEGFLGQPNVTTTLDYLSVPLLARVRLKSSIYAIVGFQVNKLLEATDQYQENGMRMEESVRHLFREWDVALVGGLRTELYNGFSLDVRYGYAPVVPAWTGSTYRLEFFQIGIAYVMEY